MMNTITIVRGLHHASRHATSSHQHHTITKRSLVLQHHRRNSSHDNSNTTVIRTLSISRMLDMGGSPSGSNDRTLIRTVNASKNSKLQAVAFDFEILVRSSSSSDNNQKSAVGSSSVHSSSHASTTTPPPPPKLNTRPSAHMDQINQVASLLKVDIYSDSSTYQNPYKDPGTISISNTTNTSSILSPTNQTTPSSLSSNNYIQSSPHEDIRAKYAKKLTRGVVGIDLAKSQAETSLAKGDAEGHFMARSIAAKQDGNNHRLRSSTKTAAATQWMANFGATKLLTYLTHRCIRIALLPNPKLVGNNVGQEQEQSYMNDLKTQLKDVVIDVTVPSLVSADTASIMGAIQTQLLQKLNMEPTQVLLVSDRDDYLKAAKELGLVTCRLQPKNARRGNISAHYTSPSIENVQEIVNEINGISFNAVLNR